MLTPTRELCIQVTQALRAYAEHVDVEVVAVFGGAPIRYQQAQLRKGAQVVVATVGRMMDLMSRQSLVLTSARYVVLDEADEMLDLGFIEDVERILRMCPTGRQTALFSATIPPPIARLAEHYMYDPVTIRVTPKKLTVDAIEQAYVEVEAEQELIGWSTSCEAEEPEQAIIFCRTKIGTARLDRTLRDRGLNVKALHGDLTQGQRDGVMISFKEHRLPLLVATDVAARGLDIEHVTHVINYDVPEPPPGTCTGSAARAASAGPGGRSPSSRPRSGARCHGSSARSRCRSAPGSRPRSGSSTPPPPRRRSEAEHPALADGAVKLFVNRGRRSGIGEDDLRWALNEGAVIPDDAIEAIRVLERFSFVELDAEHAERAVERLDGTKLKGRQLRVELARG